ncbi:hypothetical protein [Rummeliibacillus pycnus]|uniref:hypothetical protein n=1 Tax=Rummeliibacillus pycnus TaxID=101070 RepID=UPI003D276F81
MKENLKIAWIASCFALVGQLAIFIGVAIFTTNWRFVMWSFMVSMIAGVPSMIIGEHRKKRTAIKTTELSFKTTFFIELNQLIEC